MTDDEFLARFEAATLAPELFHHQDHVHMAFLYLQRHPPLEALRRFCDALTRFAAALGQPGLYNETVTWAFLLLIRERMARALAHQSWLDFATANPDLLTWKENILNRYYRPETLSSDLAKSTFLFPDKFPASAE